jgi:hypothetical protein
MIAQLFLTALLFVVLLYAWTAYRLSPTIALFVVASAFAGLFFVWFPAEATALAHFVGIGRGVDLILYTWVVISLIMLFNLHLKLRAQMEVITELARKIALANAEHSVGKNGAGSTPPMP